MIDELDPREESTADLVREAIADAKELTKLEVALAKDEVIAEVRAMKGTAVAFGVAGVGALLGVACIVLAIALAVDSWAFPLVLGILLLAIAGLGAFFGTRHLPSRPLDHTRKRLESDVQQLKERVA